MKEYNSTYSSAATKNTLYKMQVLKLKSHLYLYLRGGYIVIMLLHATPPPEHIDEGAAQCRITADLFPDIVSGV
jgi:hypothetical protein